MKLQLTPTEILAAGLRAGASAGTLRTDAVRVLEVLAEMGHDPLTRRDVTAVVEAMGHSLTGDSDAWAVIGETISAKCTSAGKRGYYTQGDQVGTPASASAAVVELVESGAMEIVRKSGLSWVPTTPTVPSEQEGYYADDEGLRRMAAASVQCFGFYSETDRACKTCPLVRFCAQSSVASMAAIVTRLDSETADALSRVAAAAAAALEVEVEVPAGDPEVIEEVASMAARSTLPEGVVPVNVRLDDAYGPDGWEEVTLPFDGVCSSAGCSKAIPEHETAIAVRGVGMFHPHCC